ncbi:MAG: ATP-binding cassette domain-containing protein [Sphingobacteriales bacterium]|nr:MAG: ATP-binding cassette domain-containing protein [Sphingobacteriales bacterium]
MIRLTNIEKYYNKGMPNEVHALKQLSLDIADKEFVVLIGSNGSGKSTLLNMIAGAELPTEGRIEINGTDVTRLPDYKRSKWIARVFQNPLSGTAPELTILDNFRLAALRTQSKKLSIGISDRFRSEVKERISHLGMGLENKLNQQMGTLSGGQRQALTLVMSIMDDVQVLLLDEPTAALDPRSAQTILQAADNIIKEYNLTGVLVTHNMKDAHQYGTRLIQMAEGNIIRDISTTEKSKLAVTDIFGWFS